jgi:hypothetical protein
MNRAAALRLSVLVSMGVVPMACGGSAIYGRDDGEGAGTGGGSSGKSASSGGTTSVPAKPRPGGAPGAGGGTIQAGSPSSGGGGSTLCTAPRTDPLTGLVQCSQGYRARPEAVECEVPIAVLPPTGGAGGEPTVEPLPRADGSVTCGDDTGCEDFELGYCDDSAWCGDEGSGGALSVCQSGCASDQDCGAGWICLCNDSDHGGACVRGDCRTNADCGAGSLCASLELYGELSFACTSPRDECATSEDCEDYGSCEIVDGRRLCVEAAFCGRPFLVDCEARVAPVIADGAWSKRGAARLPQLAHLTPDERAELAQHWTTMGQLEHASIAAFARFSLQLLALGAPPDLVDDCTRALADETAHTVLCFQLASAYAGRDIGPGMLDIQNTLQATSFGGIVELVIAEGCFGETRAALDAFDAADSAKDPVIADAYARIAQDEQRHAELAFRFVRWALERDRAAVRQRISAAILQARDDGAARGVVVPCLEALLACETGAAPPQKRSPAFA